MQVIVDGSDPNTAAWSRTTSQGVWANWLQQEALSHPATGAAGAPPIVPVDQRFWFNPELDSRNFLIPGSIAIVMTLIGTLLTALVVAREWERGTMEALLATPVDRGEFLLGKIIPYFVLGMAVDGAVGRSSPSSCFGVPFRGSVVGARSVSRPRSCCRDAGAGPADLDRRPGTSSSPARSR